MRIAKLYSHLNGREHILVHKPSLWSEIEAVVASVDATECRTKASREKRKGFRTLYSPIAMNQSFKEKLSSRAWAEARTSYWVTSDQTLIRRTMQLPAAEQRAEIAKAGFTPIFSYSSDRAAARPPCL